MSAPLAVFTAMLQRKRVRVECDSCPASTVVTLADVVGADAEEYMQGGIVYAPCTSWPVAWRANA
jgi:hypothetical protein